MLLEYKIERDSTTTKTCVFDLTPAEKEWWINKLFSIDEGIRK